MREPLFPCWPAPRHTTPSRVQTTTRSNTRLLRRCPPGLIRAEPAFSVRWPGSLRRTERPVHHGASRGSLPSLAPTRTNPHLRVPTLNSCCCVGAGGHSCTYLLQLRTPTGQPWGVHRSCKRYVQGCQAGRRVRGAGGRPMTPRRSSPILHVLLARMRASDIARTRYVQGVYCAAEDGGCMR